MGRAVITASPRIQLAMEASAGGSKAGPGEELPIARNASPRLVIAVDGTPRGTVILFSQTSEIQRWPLGSPVFRKEIELRSKSSYFWLEVRDENGDMIAMSDPIWLRPR
jgi:hypothetical protein